MRTGGHFQRQPIFLGDITQLSYQTMYFAKFISGFQHRLHRREARKFAIALFRLIFHELALQTGNFEPDLRGFHAQIFTLFFCCLRRFLAPPNFSRGGRRLRREAIFVLFQLSHFAL